MTISSVVALALIAGPRRGPRSGRARPVTPRPTPSSWPPAPASSSSSAPLPRGGSVSSSPAAALAIALDPVLHRARRRRRRHRAVERIASRRRARVVMAVSLGLSFNVLGRAEVGGMLGTVGDRHVRRRGVGLRHRHPPPFDARCAGWRGPGSASSCSSPVLATAGFAYEAVEVAPRPRHRAEHRRAGRRGARGRSVRGRRRLVPRGHRLPRVGQRPTRQAVGAVPPRSCRSPPSTRRPSRT